MGDVIEQIIARNHLGRLYLPLAQMPAPLTPQCAGQSKLNDHLPPFRCRMDSSDEEEPERQYRHLAARTLSSTTAITSRMRSRDEVT